MESPVAAVMAAIAMRPLMSSWLGLGSGLGLGLELALGVGVGVEVVVGEGLERYAGSIAEVCA